MTSATSEEWVESTLGEMLTFQRGFDITKKEQNPGPYSVISSSGPNSTHAEAKVQGPGVIIGRKGTLGTAFYSSTDFWPHDTTLWVRDFHGNNARFAYYFLQTLHLEQYDCGASNPTINRNHIHTIPVAFPPLELQRKMASLLSTYDDLIQINLRRIRVLEEIAQALYREWFVNFGFPGNETVQMVDSPIGPIPNGWNIRPASEAAYINPRMKVPKEGDKAFVPMGSLAENSMLVDGVEVRTGTSGSKFKNGDTLFARITPCLENGKTGFVQFLPSNEAVALGSTEFIVLRSSTVCPEYLYLMARSEEFRENAIKSMTGASGRQRVQVACFDKFLLANPSQEVLRSFAATVGPMFRQVHILAGQNHVLRRSRDLLLPRLISGEVDVSKLDIESDGVG